MFIIYKSRFFKELDKAPSLNQVIFYPYAYAQNTRTGYYVTIYEKLFFGDDLDIKRTIVLTI